MGAADLYERDLGEACVHIGAHRLDEAADVVTAGKASAMSSDRTNRVAASKPAGPGSSALTDQAPTAQRNCSCARARAALRSGS